MREKENRSRNGLRHPSVKVKEERQAKRQTAKREKSVGGGLTNCKQHVDVQTRAVRRTKGGAQRQEEGIKDRQCEGVTECSPERERVWVNVRAVLANSSVNLNL